MPKIFISYRRDDTLPYAGRLCEALMEEFGKDNVFMDIDSISPGWEFAVVLAEAIKGCDVLLVLMGRQWLTITGATGQRRLDDPNDFVRQEVVAALERKIIVIPVLVQSISVPPTDKLPPAMAKLVSHQACELSDTRWQYDVHRLMRAIKRSQPAERRKQRIKWAALSLVIASAACALWFSGILNKSNAPTGITGSPAVDNDVIFKQSETVQRERLDYIKEVRLLSESNNVVVLRIQYKYSGNRGANDIIMRAEAFNVRGERFAGSRFYAPVGIGEGTVDLKLSVEAAWLPLNTTNLDIAFYHYDKPNNNLRYLDGQTIPFTKAWK